MLSITTQINVNSDHDDVDIQLAAGLVDDVVADAVVAVSDIFIKQYTCCCMLYVPFVFDNAVNYGIVLFIYVHNDDIVLVADAGQWKC